MIKILRLDFLRKELTCFFQNHTLKHVLYLSGAERKLNKQKKTNPFYYYERDSDASDSQTPKSTRRGTKLQRKLMSHSIMYRIFIMTSYSQKKKNQ